jgi:hypothetical protein
MSNQFDHVDVELVLLIKTLWIMSGSGLTRFLLGVEFSTPFNPLIPL